MTAKDEWEATVWQEAASAKAEAEAAKRQAEKALEEVERLKKIVLQSNKSSIALDIS